MLKKEFFLLFFILSLYAYTQEYCAFCDPKVLDFQKFYEDDEVYGLYTHKPIVPGHCLIIPKRHVSRFEQLNDAEVLKMSHLIKKINDAAIEAFEAHAYLLLQKNGKEAGQSVFHVHFHYIPKKINESSFFNFIFKMILADFFKKPLSSIEMKKNVEKMQRALQNHNEEI